jgi:hypothetical protein
MSQRDLAAELRAARLTAPAEVRERVRRIAAADDTVRPRRFTWRRALVVALPAAAAIAAAVVLTHPSSQPTAVHGEIAPAPQAADRARSTLQKSSGGAGAARLAPLSAPNRVQQVEATLSLRVPSADGVSSAMQRALRIARSYGGYPVYVDAGSQQKRASADLTLKVPRTHLREAMTRLSALGTITAEHLDVQDLTAGINESDRAIARLQRALAGLRAQEQTVAVKRRIAQLTATVARLQRQRAATIRNAHFATVSVHLATPEQVLTHHKVQHGPLHFLGTALMWLGIGAVYVIVLGTPVVLVALLVWLGVRTVRRRREDALLSQP